ncbi:transcriptional regulator with XRE-family HTH domain [Pseudomonas frederiksbergensis]|uniref:helix-turn-helix domain-containing protein n=1 Tax=Pseudomonas frederiksbergensis TaxID=104087 RepID=UPI003D236D7A
MGLSQETLAPSQAYVSDVENGKKSPSIEKVEDLAKALGIHPVTLLAKSYLLEGEDITAFLKCVELELNNLASS